MKFFLFYSNKCRYCLDLLKMITDEKLLAYCQQICFETHPDKIPSFVLNVLTIIAPNLAKPLVGADAVEWVKNRKYYNQITNNVTTNNAVNPSIKSALKDLEYNKREASSISDHYTTINDAVIEKPMLEYNKITTNTPIEKKNIVETKINRDLQNSKLKELIVLRKLQLQSKSAGATSIEQKNK